MALLTREAIQQKRPLAVVEVDVTELGTIINHETGEREPTSVFVRELTVREKCALEDTYNIRKGKKIISNPIGVRALIILATCCDADGNLIFRHEDADHINKLPAKILERVCNEARRLNDMLMEHEKDEDEEELVKN